MREKRRGSRIVNMEEAKGVVKHIVLAKFKDDVTPEKIEELIKGYANLVNLVPPMKSFHWYATLSIAHACSIQKCY